MSSENEKPRSPHDAAADRVEAAPKPGRLGSVLRQMPTILVLAALGGLAWWGHRSDWKIPSYAQLVSAGTVQEKEDWCSEHNVPDSQCIACHPELGGGNAADWCKEHGVAESKCTICHPEVLTTGVAGDWCPEHGVPESGCTECHEEIAVKTALSSSEQDIRVLPAATATTRPATAPARRGEPDLSLAVAPTTRPGKDPKTCQTHARRVQFASVESTRRAGIKLAQVTERPITASLAANAETDYDRTRYAQIASPVSGRVWRVEKEIGQRVQKGEVLALVESAEVGKAKAELLETLASVELKTKTLERLRASAEKGFRTEAELQEAEAALTEARINLFNAQQALINLGLAVGQEELGNLSPQQARFLGLPPTLSASLDPKTTSANLVPLIAPLDGVVVERGAVAGEVIEPSKPLLAIADISRLWVAIDLPVSDASRIKLGQEVVFRPDGARDHPAAGHVTWISTAVDDQTRTVRIRAEVPNPEGRLLARSFGRAQITIRQTPSAIAVPNEAVQWEGCCYVAFVRLSDTVFQTRKLRIGAQVNGFTEVIIGVLPGEAVVSEGSHVLKSEILKSNLGAGCTDH
jgi:cobalt-zinc-cadmium efflux system membrane fusion protein